MKKTLGAMIAELRKKQGMTHLELAEKMGVTDKAVSKWERDLSCPDINSLPDLAAYLGVSVDELMQIHAQVEAEAAPPKANWRETVNTVCKAVGLAMGVAVVALSALQVLETETGILMLGLGLTCLAIPQLSEKE